MEILNTRYIYKQINNEIKGIEMRKKQLLIQKYLELYKTGRCSIDKAAEEVGITVAEMMQEAAKAGIKSDETIAEYRKGLELLTSK